ncbi:MAG: hypothetical protein J6332_09580 [Abditibacteriota bacterium]|nr:hypothetical protein [Abditibacteriota bacterium]
MVSSKKIVAAAAIALTMAFAAGSVNAAPARLSIPNNIMKGAAITSGRSFYSTNVPEDKLAGIKLGRKAQDVLKLWGNPTRISVARTSTSYEANDAVTATPAAGNMTAAMAASFPQLAGKGGLPGLTGALPKAAAPAADSVATVTVTGQEEVTWAYDLRNGITLEFIITDGLVTQITMGGVTPWTFSKTRTGLMLGDTYKLVLYVCGYPENQNYAGKFLRASYVNKSRVLYTFLDKKLVGITIAMVPTDLH